MSTAEGSKVFIYVMLNGGTVATFNPWPWVIQSTDLPRDEACVREDKATDTAAVADTLAKVRVVGVKKSLVFIVWLSEKL